MENFAMLGDLENVKPGTAADWKTNVEDNNQKPTDACPARTTAAMLLMMKITMSSPNIALKALKQCFKSINFTASTVEVSIIP